jgi:hypothetical protein
VRQQINQHCEVIDGSAKRQAHCLVRRQSLRIINVDVGAFMVPVTSR